MKFHPFLCTLANPVSEKGSIDIGLSLFYDQGTIPVEAFSRQKPCLIGKNPSLCF